MATKFIKGTPSIQINCDNSRQNPSTSKCNTKCNPLQIGSFDGNDIHTSTIEKYRHEKTQIKLGGSSALVLIDSFPTGYKKFGPDITINHEDRLILAFAEIKNFPPKYHFEFLDNSMNQEDNILQIIRRVVLPDSIVVIDNSFTDINEHLKYFYQTTVTVEMLERHNSVDQNVVSNLKQVWNNIITACDSAHDIFEVEHILESMVN